MSSFGLTAGRSGRVGLAPTHGSPDVQWRRPDGPAYLPPPLPATAARDQGERVHGLVVLALTLACTVLAIFDLFLLAFGV